MRNLASAALLACATLALPAAAQTTPPPDLSPGIKAATAAGPHPPACPRAGSHVERVGRPTVEYLGTRPGAASICRVRVAGTEFEAHDGIWALAWPGADAARDALNRVINGPTGTAVAFDTRAAPGLQWHEVIRNDGIETLHVAGQTRPALKLSHYREGFEGNTYRSVVTVWKDMETGMTIYVNYRHIAGAPEVGIAWDPSAIVAP